MIVCICHNVTDSQIKTAIQQGLNSMPLLSENLSIGTSCGKCKSCTKEILRDCLPHGRQDSSYQPLHFHALAA